MARKSDLERTIAGAVGGLSQGWLREYERKERARIWQEQEKLRWEQRDKADQARRNRPLISAPMAPGTPYGGVVPGGAPLLTAGSLEDMFRMEQFRGMQNRNTPPEPVATRTLTDPTGYVTDVPESEYGTRLNTTGNAYDMHMGADDQWVSNNIPEAAGEMVTLTDPRGQEWRVPQANAITALNTLGNAFDSHMNEDGEWVAGSSASAGGDKATVKAMVNGEMQELSIADANALGNATNRDLLSDGNWTERAAKVIPPKDYEIRRRAEEQFGKKVRGKRKGSWKWALGSMDFSKEEVEANMPQKLSAAYTSAVNRGDIDLWDDGAAEDFVRRARPADIGDLMRDGKQWKYDYTWPTKDVEITPEQAQEEIKQLYDKEEDTGKDIYYDQLISLLKKAGFDEEEAVAWLTKANVDDPTPLSFADEVRQSGQRVN